jgi:hypothetical protein
MLQLSEVGLYPMTKLDLGQLPAIPALNILDVLIDCVAPLLLDSL